MKTTYYPAGMDGRTTFGTVLVVLTAIAFVVVSPYIPDKDGGLSLRLSAVAMAVLILLAWQIRPLKYDVSDDAVTIVRSWPFRNVVIPLSDVRHVERVTIEGYAKSLNSLAGVFATTGWLYSRQLGKYFASITDRRKAVMLDGTARHVLSPEKADEFVADVMDRMADGR